MSNFPVNPTLGQLWTAPNGFEYRWTAKGTWRRVATEETLERTSALSQLTLGSNLTIDGFVVTPTATPSMNVTLNPGVLMGSGPLEQSITGNVHAINKIATLLDPINLPQTGTFALPNTSGQSINYLIQIAYGDAINTPQSNPQGDVLRIGRVLINIKSGTAAATGSQGTPSADPNYTAVAVVTVSSSTSSINAAQITRPSIIPVVLDKLPALATAIQNNKYSYCHDTGTPDNYVVKPVPAFAQRVEGTILEVAIAGNNTNKTAVPQINDGSGTSAYILRADGTAPVAGDIRAGTVLRLRVDAALNYRMTGPAPSDIAAIAQAQQAQQSTTDPSLLVATGTIAYFAMGSAPTGWLFCNGAAISRTAFANLYTALQNTYGAGDGVTTFNIPDLRGVFLRGWDGGRGVDTSRTFATTQGDALRSHTHALTGGGLVVQQYGGGPDAYIPGSDTPDIGLHCVSIDYTGDVETRPVNVAVYPCIKY